MVQGAKEKISFVAVSLAFVAIYLLHPDVRRFGLHSGCSWYAHISYPFLHASWWHLAANLYALYMLLSFRPSLKFYILAFIISVTFPFIISTPIIGLSGFLCALMGLVWWKAKNVYLYHILSVSFILFGFFFSSAAAFLHFYCYTLGVFLGWLNKPLD